MMSIFIKRYKKATVMKDNPVLIGVVAGIRFYEHPIFGDEYPLIAVIKEKCGLTNFWEIPSLEQLGNFV